MCLPDNTLFKNYLVGKFYAHHFLMNNNLYMPPVTAEKHIVQMKRGDSDHHPFPKT